MCGATSDCPARCSAPRPPSACRRWPSGWKSATSWRQRVAIARALAHAPRLLLADEPTAALDPLNAERVMRLLVEQARERGACTVVATHDERLARAAGLEVLAIRWQREADDSVGACLEDVG